MQTALASNNVNLHKEENGGLIERERIRERLRKVEMSKSSYDTAWVAMVPNSDQSQPRFVGCLEWVMENQKEDGSWGLNPGHPLFLKDTLSSTLASLLALQKWNLGEQLIQKGLDFIGSKKYAVMDKTQSSPIGFDIIFPGMINEAHSQGLNLSLDSHFVSVMLRNRDLQCNVLKFELKGKGELGYIGEGLGESYDWKEAMKNEQRSNGSLFNSPATTAAALIHFHDHKCLGYLQSLVNIHGKSVPTVYPFDVYSRLCIVDTLDRLGIDRYFKHEIKAVLDEIIKYRQERSEDIFSDVACCALAFRLLRMNGYQVSSEALADYVDQEAFFSTVNLHSSTVETIVHLHQASQITILEKEPILDKINTWTRTFLKHHNSTHEIICHEKLEKEIEYALNIPIDTVDRLKHRRGIELYNTYDFRMLKTAYRCSNTDNKDLLMLAVQDFNECQAIHCREIKQLEKWVKDSRIMSLEFEWHTLISSYIQLAAIHFEPELSDLRIAWTKNSFVGTIIDDMFDIDASRTELLNLIELLERLHGNSDIGGFCSKRNEIIFLAVEEIVNEQAEKGFNTQGRCIKHELIEIWVAFLKGCLQELDWWENKSTPTMDEYVRNGCQTFGIGLYSINFYFLGPYISNDLFKCEEYLTLYRHAGLSGRLFNDYQGLERDKIQRKMNGCMLLVSHRNGTINKEEARTEVRRMIKRSKRATLQMMVEKKPTCVPKPILESFFKLYKVFYYLYNSGDEYRNPASTFDDINALRFEEDRKELDLAG